MSIAAKLILLLGMFLAGAAVAHRYDMGQNAIKENARLELVREQEKANRATERQQSTQVVEALNASKKRAHDAQVAAGAADSAAGRLRDDIADLQRRLPQASHDACRSNAATLGTVLNSCIAEYGSMARDAQGHADDSVMYQQAWPK